MICAEKASCLQMKTAIHIMSAVYGKAQRADQVAWVTAIGRDNKRCVRTIYCRRPLGTSLPPPQHHESAQQLISPCNSFSRSKYGENPGYRELHPRSGKNLRLRASRSAEP
jgi:hypothetical protein